MPKIVLHLKPDDALGNLGGWHLRLYRQILQMCASDGITCEVETRDADLKVGTRSARDGRFDDGNLHIIDDRSIQAKGVLNAGVAYFWEYWHLDPVGTKAFSSIALERYEPGAVTAQRADAFFYNLSKRYVQKRRSKYDQPADVQQVPEGAVAVFFQGCYPVNSGATTYSDLEILQAVQAYAGDRPIVVKPHPLASQNAEIQAVREAAQHDVRIHLTNANVHDILLSSVVTVSVNSTVALEGFMHNTPAILFGKSDFHHFSTTIGAPEAFPAALEAELARQSGYAQFLAWYFLKHCLPINSGKLHEKIWQRFANAGFGRDYFS